MKAFLEIIAERLINKFPASMDKIAIVLPSKRSVVFLKSYLSERIEKPIFLPDFFSIEEFIESLSGLKVIDNLSLQFYLYQTYLKFPSSKIDSFDDFLAWSEILLHDFNEVDKDMVNAKAIFANLKNVKDLENWDLEDWSLSSDTLTISQQDFIHFYDNIYNWYLDFNKNLRENKLSYQGMAYKEVANEIMNKQIPWKKIWFVGLNAFTKSETKIIDYLRKENIARVFWDADEYYYMNKDYEAGKFLREQSEEWKEIDFEGVGKYFNQKKESFNIIACPKNISQARAASQVIKSFSSDDLSQSNTAIVLADEALLYPVLNHLPSNVKEINVTMGSPLKHTLFYSFLESLFQMHLGAKEKEELVFYYKDILKVINHPLFSQLVGLNYISKLRKKIISQNKVFVSSSMIRHFLLHDIEKIEFIFSSWQNIFNCIQSIEGLILCFRDKLVDNPNSIESEVLFAFNKSFALIKSFLSENTFKVDLISMQTILKRLIAKEVVPFKGEPLKGIQIMGILESRTLDFKNVILLSVNEGVLPKGKTFNSFIPYDLKRYFDMPTYRESDAVFSYHFYRLLQRANNITILYNTETDELGSGEKSRFISQLISEYKHNTINQFVFGGDKLDFKQEIPIHIKNNGLEDEIKKWASMVSPSALNMYVNCSLSFYYKYLAKIRKSDEVKEFAENNIIGSAIHEAFDDIYPLGDISPSDIKKTSQKIIDTVEDKFLRLMGSDNVNEGKNYLSLQIAKRLASNFMRFEERYLEESIKKGNKLKILESEGIFKYHLNIDGVDFDLQGKIDRVDEFQDELRIVDYKSGRVEQKDVSFKKWEDLYNSPSKGKVLQLLVYSYLYLKNNPHYLDKKIISGIFSFKNLNEKFITVSNYINNKKSTIYIDQSALDQTELLIKNIVKSIMKKDFVQTEDKKRCEYCDYKFICNR